MTRVFLSDAEGVFARAFAAQAAARDVKIALPSDGDGAIPDGVEALILCDLVPALMLCPDPADAAGLVPVGPALARIEELIDAAAEAGIPRLVAISATRVPQCAVPPAVAETAARLETALARAGTDRVVVLRAAEVMDPMAPVTQAAVRRLIRGGGSGGHGGDPIQGVALSDLAAAAAAAAEVSGAAGRWFDIVAPEAVDRLSFAAEAERLAQILTNPTVTEVNARPAYPSATPLRDAAPTVLALHVAPSETPWTVLAKTVQELVRQASAAGRLPSMIPSMPAVHEALETGALPLAGKQVVLTGATHGIGPPAAKMLVRLGAEVTGIARDASAGAVLAEQIAAESPAWERLRARHARKASETGRSPTPVAGQLGHFRFERADLSDLDEVRALAALLSERLPRIDALIHAGLVTLPRRRETAQGLETIFAANLVAPVTLTRLLAGPLLAAGADGGARIVNVVADGHEAEPLDLEDLQSRWSYVPHSVLARTGSGLIVMTAALAEAMAGTGISAIAVNPGNIRGGVAEDLTDTGAKSASTRQRLEAQQQARRQRGQSPALSPAESAAHLVDVLVSPQFAEINGGYVAGGAISEPAPHVLDPALADALWRVCAEHAGLKP